MLERLFVSRSRRRSSSLPSDFLRPSCGRKDDGGGPRARTEGAEMDVPSAIISHAGKAQSETSESMKRLAGAGQIKRSPTNHENFFLSGPAPERRAPLSVGGCTQRRVSDALFRPPAPSSAFHMWNPDGGLGGGNNKAYGQPADACLPTGLGAQGCQPSWQCGAGGCCSSACGRGVGRCAPVISVVSRRPCPT